MKKNLLLYILLVFLIVVNGFFVFNYLGKPDANKENGREDPMDFIFKKLKFDDVQLEKMELINEKHHLKMMGINDGLKELKDLLFNRISDETLNDETIDSITSLIGGKLKERDKEAFYHFRSIQELCNDKQKEKFKNIINDALLKSGGQDNRPPPGEGGDRNGPPPMGGEHPGPPPPPPMD